MVIRYLILFFGLVICARGFSQKPSLTLTIDKRIVDSSYYCYLNIVFTNSTNDSIHIETNRYFGICNEIIGISPLAVKLQVQNNNEFLNLGSDCEPYFVPEGYKEPTRKLNSKDTVEYRVDLVSGLLKKGRQNKDGTIRWKVLPGFYRTQVFYKYTDKFNKEKIIGSEWVYFKYE